MHTCDNIDSNPHQPISKDTQVTFIDKYEKEVNSFDYMFIDRLRQDCEYYLNYGNKNKNALYYKNEKEHIEEMKKLYNKFPENKKPNFLTYEQILNYEKLMIK